MWFGLQPSRMLAAVPVWKETVILSGLKNGEGKIHVHGDDLKQKSIDMLIDLYTHTHTKV